MILHIQGVLCFRASM
uniref:Uncharacterized protein n=1 Tax=Anguilla anguilla TaxID=7936 RepID=A0A0E9TME3_ANGAN